MSNSLIYKIKSTLIVNDVNNNLQNKEIDYTYTKSLSQTAALAVGATLTLPCPSTLQTTIPFIELVADYAVDLSFKDDAAATITSLKSINYLAGNVKGYSFSITNNSTEESNIQWSIYY
jgi:hypothetical protein